MPEPTQPYATVNIGTVKVPIMVPCLPLPLLGGVYNPNVQMDFWSKIQGVMGPQSAEAQADNIQSVVDALQEQMAYDGAPPWINVAGQTVSYTHLTLPTILLV